MKASTSEGQNMLTIKIGNCLSIFTQSHTTLPKHIYLDILVMIATITLPITKIIFYHPNFLSWSRQIQEEME